jgi:hypothetical protein
LLKAMTLSFALLFPILAYAAQGHNLDQSPIKIGYVSQQHRMRQEIFQIIPEVQPKPHCQVRHLMQTLTTMVSQLNFPQALEVVRQPWLWDM